MKEISTYIAEGAMAFLKAEWKVLGYFVVIVAFLLAVMASQILILTGLSRCFYYWRGIQRHCRLYRYEGATKANVRTAQAARTSLSKALNVSFTGGSVWVLVLPVWRYWVWWFIYCFENDFLLLMQPLIQKKWSGPLKC